MNDARPLFRGYIHQAMFFVALGACALLILKAAEGRGLFGVAIFSLGTLLMFGISALYHRILWDPLRRAYMRKLDHSSIYLMIAGTFTPICILALPKESGVKLLTTIWIIAGIGLLQAIFFTNLPKIVSAMIYIVAGYMVVPYLDELAQSFSGTQMTFLVLGGLSYTFGGLAYGLKRPRLNPTCFGYHEVFHILVALGAVFHFAMVYTLL